MSSGLAFLFNYLFFSKPIGISVFIFAVVFLAAVVLFGMRQGIAMKRSWWLILLIAFFAFMPSLRANEFLTFLNVCAVLGLLILLVYQLVGIPVKLMRFINYFTLVVFVPFRMLSGAFSTISSAGQISSLETEISRKESKIRELESKNQQLQLDCK